MNRLRLRLRLRKGIRNLTIALILGFSLSLNLNLSLSPVSAQELSDEILLPLPAPIVTEWRNRLDALKMGEGDKAAAALERIKKISDELGLENIELISMALLIEANEHISKGEIDAALEAAYAAKEISPSYPPSYYLISRILFIRDKSIAGPLSNYIDGGIESYKDFWHIFYQIGTIAIILLLSIISSFIIFILYMILRYIPLLEHNLSEWVGIPFKRYTIIMMIIITVSSIPLLFRRGFIWIPIFSLLIIWVYLRKRERLLGGFLLILIGLSLFFFKLSGPFFVSNSSKELELMNRIFRGEWIPEQSQYEDIINKDKDDWRGYFSVAISMKMQGRYDEALQYYEHGLTKEVGSAKILNNIGNLFFYKRDYEKAIEFYKKAIEKDNKLISSHYNMSQALREKLSFDEGNKKYEDARGLNRRLTDLYTKKSTLSPQYLVIDENFSIPDLFKKAVSLKEEKRGDVAADILIFISGMPTSFFLASLSILIFFIIFLSSHLKRKGYLSILCPACGRAICRGCQRYIYDIKVCNSCLVLLKKRQGRKEDIKEIEIMARKREKMAIILSFLIPGTGHLHMDRPIKGYIVNLILFILIWSWLIDGILMKVLLSSPAIIASYRNLYYPLLMLLIAGYSVFDIYQSQEYI